MKDTITGMICKQRIIYNKTLGQLPFYFEFHTNISTANKLMISKPYENNSNNNTVYIKNKQKSHREEKISFELY